MDLIIGLVKDYMSGGLIPVTLKAILQFIRVFHLQSSPFEIPAFFRFPCLPGTVGQSESRNGQCDAWIG